MVSQEGLSIRPSDMVEGAAVPQNMNLRVTAAKFTLFEYGGKSAQPAVGAMLSLIDDQGVTYEQFYSAGSTERIIPSVDGKKLMPVGTATAVVKSSNFHILMRELVNAGFPENKLDKDVSSLTDLYAYWIGLPEPERLGLKKKGEDTGRTKILCVPQKILRLPWETAGATTGVGAALDAEVVKAATELVDKALATSPVVTRAQLAGLVFSGEMLKHPKRNEISALVFSPQFKEILQGKGMKVDGENISK